MAAKRKKHTSEFKAQVALAALKSNKSLQQLAEEFELHPVQVSTWKKRLSSHAARLFENGKQQARELDFSAERRLLHSKIGELTIKLDLAYSTAHHQNGSKSWKDQKKPTRPKRAHGRASAAE
jgi:transposase-like protein